MTNHFTGIRWRELGPLPGRSFQHGNWRGWKSNVYYFGGVGGGVWKSTDAGRTWGNIHNNYFGGTVGAVAVSASDPNVIYAGEGEQTLQQRIFRMGSMEINRCWSILETHWPD